jgi:molybdate transport system ATP-binding protein
MERQRTPTPSADQSTKPAKAPTLETTVFARILKHDPELALTSLLFDDGELRLPMVDLPLGSSVIVKIDARDVAIALSRPMDVSITNRLPGTIDEIELLAPPYARATFSLGKTRLHSLITRESVARLALEPGLKAWAMIKAVAISGRGVSPDRAPHPRSWPSDRSSSRETR